MNNTELCKLIEERKDELIVFVGVDGNHCLTPDIASVSMNGGSIQITLADCQRMPKEARPYLNTHQLAEKLNIPYKWLLREARDGRIPSLRTGLKLSTFRYVPEDVVEAIDKNNGAA